MLSRALRLLRVYHDMKQKDLAKELGLSCSHISEIESGNKTPSFEVVKKYADLFKVPVSSILFFSEQMERATDNTVIAKKTRDVVASKILKILETIEFHTKASDV